MGGLIERNKNVTAYLGQRYSDIILHTLTGQIPNDKKTRRKYIIMVYRSRSGPVNIQLTPARVPKNQASGRVPAVD